MATGRSARIKLAVERKYSTYATEGKLGSCCGTVSTTLPVSKSSCCGVEGSRIPRSATEVTLSCGSPLQHTSLWEGETVLDLGSGGGADVFRAANMVGKNGRVIGIDSTAKMVARAKRAAQENGYANVEFRLGEMEKLPVRSRSADLVISNCAVNLVPNKRRAFSEMHRVLRSGGRFVISDIVSREEIPNRVRGDTDKWSRCISGAITMRGLRRILSSTGFVNFEVLEESAYEKGKEDGLSLSSVTFTASKP